MKRLRKVLAIMAAVFALFLGLYIISFQPPKYYFNLSESEPLGLYKLVPFDGHLRIGDLVIFEVPKQARPYVYGRAWLPKSWPLLKNVGAMPGDKINITDSSIKIGDSYVGPVFRFDSQGKPLPHLRGEFRIPKKHFLPIATHISNSFDGRYFGPVPFSLIRGKTQAIITLK